jgi:steroid delta-isomerase-like uncharacterized protein
VGEVLRSHDRQEVLPMADAMKVANDWLEAFNAHDADGMRSVTAADAVLEAPGRIHVEGRDDVVEYALSWLGAFSDAEMAVDHQLAADGWVVQRFTFEGTHTDTLAGPLGEIEATDRHLAGRGAQFMRVDDGRIAETHLYFDQIEVLMQLGLLAEPATRTR